MGVIAQVFVQLYIKSEIQVFLFECLLVSHIIFVSGTGWDHVTLEKFVAAVLVLQEVNAMTLRILNA